MPMDVPPHVALVTHVNGGTPHLSPVLWGHDLQCTACPVGVLRPPLMPPPPGCQGPLFVPDSHAFLLSQICTVRASKGDDTMAACGQLGDPGSSPRPAPMLQVPERLREVMMQAAGAGAGAGAGVSEAMAGAGARDSASSIGRGDMALPEKGSCGCKS